MVNRKVFAAHDDESSDDEAPVAVGVSEAREAHEAREATRPTRENARMSQMRAEKKLKGLVTAGLRGDDYLPPEVLDQLPRGPSGQRAEGADESTRLSSKRAKRAAAAAAEAAAAAASSSRELPTGLPRVVSTTDTVDVAVLDGKGGPRLHAPVRTDVRSFMEKQLYGERNKRVPAATLASLKPSGRRFGPASNFASVPLAPASGVTKKKKKGKVGGGGGGGGAGYSSLERMAAAIMNKSKQSGARVGKKL